MSQNQPQVAKLNVSRSLCLPTYHLLFSSATRPSSALNAPSTTIIEPAKMTQLVHAD
jgi:hypothetical protein